MSILPIIEDGEDSGLGRSTRERTRSGRLVVDAEELDEGAHLGRFRIVRHLGRGGMGAVYEAEDTLLERRVALKVVAALSENGRTRMLSEARALAKIKHANVVQLHDVGVDEERVYLALELVRGTTLTHWLADNDHDWGDVVVHFAAAGRGLAEAHDNGLAHGDFKPSNVLVASDGRVLVSDFGLAQSMESETTNSGSTSSTQKRRRIVGTPAYMAPELYRGATKNAATDQFAFCVALYEALFGRHPFGGGSWEAVARQISAGELQAPPTAGNVPRHVRRAVMRGLSHRAGQRWLSMGMLLDRITGPPTRAIPRSAWAVGGVAVVGLTTLALARDPNPCVADPSMLGGAWDDEVRVRVAASFVGPEAERNWTQVETAIDDWSRHWLTAHQTVCRASQDGDQTDAELDARMACLRRANRSLAALTDVLGHSDPDAVFTAMSAVAELPPPTDCTSAGPTGPGAPPSEGGLLGTIERGQALQRIGRLFDAQALAETALIAADDANDCEASAMASLLLGRVLREQGQAVLAVERFERGVERATSCGRLDLVADTSLAMAETVARRGIDAAAARSWLSRARNAAAASTSGPSERSALFDARTLLTDARIAKFTGDHEAVERHIASALAIVPAEGDGDHAARSTSVRAMLLELRAQTLVMQGRTADAEAAFSHSLEVLTEALGSRNPRLAGSLVGLARVAMMSGDRARATEHLQSALRVLNAGYGPTHPRTALVLNNLAALEAEDGDYEAARAYMLQAIQTLTAAGGQRPEDLITMRVNAATLAGNGGDHESAILEARAALFTAETEVGRDTRIAALALRVLATNQNAAGRFAEAEKAARRAVTILDRTGDTLTLHSMRALLGEVLSSTPGNGEEVVALLAPVRKACEPDDTAMSARACARAAFFTATGLPESTPLARRVALVAEARELVADDGKLSEYQRFHDRLEAWPDEPG